MLTYIERNWRPLTAILAITFSLIGVQLVITDEDGDGRPDKVVIQKPIAGDLAPQEATVDGAATIKPAESELRDETPDDVPETVIEEARDEAEDLPDLEPKPVGGAQNYEIQKKIDYADHVWGSRDGHEPRFACLHYTVSSNVAGWADIDAIDNYFLRTEVGSATFIVDFEGHIRQTVPRDGSPWTQGFFNDWCISWEIIATGSETRQQWLNSPLIKDRILANHVRDELRRMGAPIRFVNPAGCDVSLSGWTDHNAFECGNDHHDVLPNFPYDVFQKQLLEGPCGDRCEELKAREAASHRRYRERNCKPTAHEHTPKQLRREECKRVKRKIHEQHTKLRERYGIRA